MIGWKVKIRIIYAKILYLTFNLYYRSAVIYYVVGIFKTLCTLYSIGLFVQPSYYYLHLSFSYNKMSIFIMVIRMFEVWHIVLNCLEL